MWTEAFLSDRPQNVSVNGILSLSRPVVSGVPQGSVLGPVLFLLFINDISSSVQSNLRLFADGCVLYREVAVLQVCQALQQDLYSLFLWSETLQLPFNVTKYYHLGITSTRTPLDLDYSLNGKFISRVSSTTYLGIHNTANSTLCLFRRILSGCSAEAKSSAYLTLVRPKREYASSVWNPYKQCNINVEKPDLCSMIFPVLVVFL